jgi:hypothetical protein
MNVLVVALLFSLQAARVAPPVQPPANKATAKAPRKGGTWYFAENGHAVYCYGPVMRVSQPEGGLQTIATFCKGAKIMVPLKD